MDERMFMSTDSVLNTKVNNLNKSHVLKKSGSVDGTHRPSMIAAMLNENEPFNALNRSKIKIKSTKDLRNSHLQKSKQQCSKSKGHRKKPHKKLVDKICWDNLDNKENIRKYMKKKRKKIIKDENKEKITDFKKQTKIFHNLRELHKFTRLQTRRIGAFKERSASTQHKLFTGRHNNGYIFDTDGDSFFKESRNKDFISNRKLSSLYPNDLQTQLKRTKKIRMKSSSSTLSSKLSTEFYLEYFKILKNIQKNGNPNNTIVYDRASPKRKRSSKRRICRASRPKSAPGLRKITKINKGRRGTVDAERMASYHKKCDIGRQNLSYNKSCIEARKSYSPNHNKKKRKKKSAKKYTQGRLQKEDFTRVTKISKILNFKFKPGKEENRITLREARAAFYIYMIWKLNKYVSQLQDAKSDSCKLQSEQSVIQDSVKYSSRLEDDDVSNHYLEHEMEYPELDKNHLDRYNEMAYHESNESENDEDYLKSFRPSDPKPEYPTTKKQRIASGCQSNKSMIEYEEEDSEVTQVLVRSTKAEEEVKETEENEVFREEKKQFFEDDFEKDDKVLSPHNPFDEMQDTIDFKDKVVHLSTINTNENLVQEDLNEDPSDNEQQRLDISNNEFEDFEGEESVVKVISDKDENDDSQKTENHSDMKQNLFSGPDSLLREIISRTPRSTSEPFMVGDKTNPEHYQNLLGGKDDDNSDAATKKRVDVSNLQGTITPNSSVSSQFFQNNSSFQRFSILQFNNMIDSKDFGVLLQLREKAIRYREKTEKKLIDKMIESQKYSPRMLNDRKLQLERWISREKEEIKITKNQLLEKWNQTKAILEQTEYNAKMIKQQLGSVDCSRKASMNIASPVSEHGIDSLNLFSYREESKTINNESIDDDEETKIIQYSEPQRLANSESGNFAGNNSNSVISLRISVLSNRSGDFNIYTPDPNAHRLQRTSEFNKILSLVPEHAVDSRKNQSETFHVGSIFKRLLEEEDDLEVPNDESKEETPRDETLSKTKNIFEYRPQDTIELPSKPAGELIVDDFSTPPEHKLQLDLLGSFEDDGEIVPRQKRDRAQKDDNTENSESFSGHHHRKSSSNDNIGIEKVDDLNLEAMLDNEDAIDLEDDFYDSLPNKFSDQVDRNFLKDLNDEINTKNLENMNSGTSEDLDIYDKDTPEKALTPEMLQKEPSVELSLSKKYPVPKETEIEEAKILTKPNIYLPQVYPEPAEGFTKSKPNPLTDAFSPQNLAAKLLNSLNNKPKGNHKTNDMLIFDDTSSSIPIDTCTPPSVEISHSRKSKDDHFIPNKIEHNKDSVIETGAEVLTFPPKIEILDNTEKKLDDKEILVNELMSQLVNEIKECMFPPRDNFTECIEGNDTSS